MYSRFSESLCSPGGKCLVCQSNDFWKVVFTGLNWSRVREALELYVNLIRFSISAGEFCPLFSLDILIKMTSMQFMLQHTYRRWSKSLVYYMHPIMLNFCSVTSAVNSLSSSCIGSLRAGQYIGIVSCHDKKQEIVTDFRYRYIVILHKCCLFPVEKASLQGSDVIF